MCKCLFIGLLLTLTACGCGKKVGASSGEATLEDLNQAMAVMSMGGARRPADINDLTNFPSLRGKTLPKPPAGKKLAIDPSQQKVVFVDQ
jgi:hypothetical protein